MSNTNSYRTAGTVSQAKTVKAPSSREAFLDGLLPSSRSSARAYEIIHAEAHALSLVALNTRMTLRYQPAVDHIAACTNRDDLFAADVDETLADMTDRLMDELSAFAVVNPIGRRSPMPGHRWGNLTRIARPMGTGTAHVRQTKLISKLMNQHRPYNQEQVSPVEQHLVSLAEEMDRKLFVFTDDASRPQQIRSAIDALVRTTAVLTPPLVFGENTAIYSEKMLTHGAPSARRFFNAAAALVS